MSKEPHSPQTLPQSAASTPQSVLEVDGAGGSVVADSASGAGAVAATDTAVAPESEATVVSAVQVALPDGVPSMLAIDRPVDVAADVSVASPSGLGAPAVAVQPDAMGGSAQAQAAAIPATASMLRNDPSTITAGQLLRQAREARGLTLDNMATMLKVPVPKLQALEADDWSHLPDAVFTRSLALGVCRMLHMDSAPVLALLPKGGATRLTAHPEGLNQPLQERATRHSSPSASLAVDDSSGSWKLWLVAALLLGAAVWAGVYWEPQWRARLGGTNGSSADSGAVTDVAPPAASSAVNEMASVPVVTPAGSVTSPPMQSETQASAESSASAQTVPVPAEPVATGAQPMLDASQVSAEAAPAPVIVSPALRVRALAQLRVQINDYQRNMATDQVLQPGEFLDTTSTHLGVTIDQAGAAQVEIHGRAFDLSSVTQNNVARFEVK